MKKDLLIDEINQMRYSIVNDKKKLYKNKLLNLRKLKEKIFFSINYKSNENEASLLKSITTPNPASSNRNKIAVPRWIPDELVKNCTLCSKNFNLLNRKHHCRVCGDIFCVKCCHIFSIFEPFYKIPVRMCTICFSEARYEIHTNNIN